MTHLGFPNSYYVISVAQMTFTKGLYMIGAMRLFQTQAKAIGLSLFLSVFCLIDLTQAQDQLPDSPAFEGYVSKILDFPILQLKSEQVIVLSGIERPATHNQTGLHISSAKLWLTQKLLGQTIQIQPTGNSYDLFGRIHALVRLPAENWINHQLLNQGLAFAQYEIGFPYGFQELLRQEKLARENHKGLWADKEVKQLAPATLKPPFKGYHVIEGRIHRASLRKNYLYLNFGENWREDFTIGIPTKDKSFDTKTMKEIYTEGRLVQIRGVLEKWNGPFIRLYAKEHLILLD